MDQKPPEFVIIVKGAANTGKTALTHIIEDALRSNGIESVSVAEDIRPEVYLMDKVRRGRVDALVRRQPQVLIRPALVAHPNIITPGVIDREVIPPYYHVYRFPPLKKLTKEAMTKAAQVVADKELPHPDERHNSHDDEFPMPHHHYPAVEQAARDSVKFVEEQRAKEHLYLRGETFPQAGVKPLSPELVARIAEGHELLSKFGNDVVPHCPPGLGEQVFVGRFSERNPDLSEQAHGGSIAPDRKFLFEPHEDDSFFNDKDIGENVSTPRRPPQVQPLEDLEPDVDHHARAHTD